MKKVLLTDCPDAKGLIAKITGLCFEHQLNIIKNNEFVDNLNQRFFMRTELEGDFEKSDLLTQLRTILPPNSHVSLKDQDKLKVVLLATKEAHCLGGVLLKCFENALNIEVVAVIANYADLAPLVTGFGVPFHVISHEGLTRDEHDAQVAAKIATYQPDLVGLAKYMRILTPEFVRQFNGKIINIHHSFLPAFIGAKPYEQAYQRGVKIIGATAHFVTDELDEGPIIAQDVIHVTHDNGASDLAKLGRDVEKNVFCRALQLACEHRIFINDNKTVVFR
ncbi:formyltetrahydrofolate deformylase [Pseudoalteromonas tunicata]|uniref:formyltetrahydrofolate deformylase n=1 Tax=Pseudoalteromonas tunicata TaxID=314281 RepID=UPI00273F8F04|nr:formyltetrahydrofolate deformylase [Pseudoalteromonas tunicata]MDP4983201.1 formyltetrahydrofolate deformylase [Pseudoalteromonas tunicata]MDP5211799.1 formyltetrahydrofolate deformylase [Pseudoalteromonas tunicata]